MKTHKTRSDFIDITGMRVGRLTVIRREIAGRQAKFLCRCDCGNEKIITSSCLRAQKTKSCGCLNSEIVKQRNYKHGEITHHSMTKEYRAWLHMKGRCSFPSDKQFHNYGGRGITVCERWVGNFGNFLSDMGRCPNGYSLERRDVNGNYEPVNCEWIPMKDQPRNTRFNVRLTAFGKTAILADWARELGVTYGAIKFHLAKGRTMEDVVRHFK